MQALDQTQETDLFRKPCGSLHFSPNYGLDLIVCQRVDIVGASARSVRLSADGCGWHSEPHSGPESGDAIYVEHHYADGSRSFHGWVDAASRCVIQWG